MKKIITLLFCLFVVSEGLAQNFGPVNMNASPEAKKLLAFIYILKGNILFQGSIISIISLTSIHIVLLQVNILLCGGTDLYVQAPAILAIT